MEDLDVFFFRDGFQRAKHVCVELFLLLQTQVNNWQCVYVRVARDAKVPVARAVVNYKGIDHFNSQLQLMKANI